MKEKVKSPRVEEIEDHWFLVDIDTIGNCGGK